MPFLCLCGERGEPLGGGGTSSAPTPGLCLSQAPGRRGYCWCQGGAVSAESRNFYQASSTKRKENPQSKIRGTGPSHPTHPSCTKKCKHYHKKGVSERPFAQALRPGSALPCPGHRVRRGRALDQEALVGGPRLAELGQGHVIMQVPSRHCPHCSCCCSGLWPCTACPRPGF